MKAVDQNNPHMFYHIFHSFSMGLGIYNRQGTLISLNEQAIRFFGVLDPQAMCNSYNLFKDPNFDEATTQRIRDGEAFDFTSHYNFHLVGDCYATSRTGTVKVYFRITRMSDNTGEDIGFILITRDNAELIGTISRLRHLEKVFNQMGSFAKVGYCRVNLQTNEHISSKQWYANIGADESVSILEFMKTSPTLHPDDRDRIHQRLMKKPSDHGTIYRDEVRVEDKTRPDGWRWLCINTLLEQDNRGHTLLTDVNFDITVLKESEQHLREARDRAQAADRLKSTFLANMSHEIRTPLNAIVGFSSLMIETQDTGQRKEYHRIIEANNKLLLQLISDILDLAKIEAGTMEFTYHEVSLNTLCEEMVTSLRHNVREQVQMHFNRPPTDCLIRGDANRIKQVLANLLNNAAKFTLHGSISVDYQRYDEAQLVCILVKDTGIGITPERKEEVFNRFVKLNTFMQGTGLGLAICQSIVHQMGGEIGVESEPGKGSCFWFTLPCR
jgi:signal transduction histidine kinase